MMDPQNSLLNTSKGKGFFLVLDGIDGTGKSTQIKMLINHYTALGVKVYSTYEPSRGELGLILRKYLKNNQIPASLDALIFAADRIDHITKEILPKLEADFLVICDRYRDSSYVYQSIQGKNQDITEGWIREINKFSLDPDLTLILDMDPSRSLQRRLTQLEGAEESPEKFEKIDFQRKIRREFQRISKTAFASDPHSIIDADQSQKDVFNQILDVLHSKLVEKGIIIQK